MARGWRVLDATSFQGVVSGARGRLILTSAEGEANEVPAEEAALLLIGHGTSISSSVLHYLAKHDIALLGADWKSVPFAGFYPWNDHGRVAARHLAQANLSVPRRKRAWQQLVKAKIHGQAANLESVDPKGARRLRELAGRVRSGDPDNAEGTAARMYWPRLFYETWFIRDQDSSDLFNASLNYGYMVLRGFGVRAVVAAGLSPPLGLFHRGRSNYFNLVDDLIEPFRPAIDHVVAGLSVGESIEDSATKHKLVSAASQPFLDDGRRIPTALEDLAQQLGRYVEGQNEHFSVPAWQVPDKSLRPIETDIESPGDPPW